MIIRSLRLLNIKSYGEGPEGRGITVHFEPGINRIAGKNGHGKSTLIESLGYALFLTRPIYEEGFDIATYLLRSGNKSGEIDVVFELNGEGFRLERGVGQSKRRAKVVLLRDGSTEAEGDKQVAEYLCRLVGCDEGRLSELFAKLAGVKQGRLTWPFDSKPAEARKYFEPLLDVEIFRECFDQLKPVVDRFEALKTEHEKELAVIEQCIQDRADSPEKVKAQQQSVDTLRQKVETGGQAKQAAEKDWRLHEARDLAQRQARSAWEAALNELKLATQRKQQQEAQVQESRDSAATVHANQAGYELYRQAEQALRGLQEQQEKKSKLEKHRAEAASLKTGCEAKARAARESAENYAKQKAAKTTSAQQLSALIAAGQKFLRETKEDFERRELATSHARQSWDALEHWLRSAEEQINANAERVAELLEAGKQLSAWKPDSLAQARAQEEQTDLTLKDLAEKLAAAKKLNETLVAQLEQIAGGMCPFLKENCRQFDPRKIQSDVSLHEQAIRGLTQEHQRAAGARRQARELVERLAKEEAKLGQLGKALEKNAESFVKEHNKLLPSAVRQHFVVLREYLLARAAGLELLTPPEAGQDDFYDKARACIDPAAVRRLADAEQEFHAQATRQLGALASELKTEFKSFEQQRDERLRKETGLKNHQDNLRSAETEIRDLTAGQEAQDRLALQANGEAKAAEKQVAELEEQLKAYANLERELKQQQGLKEQHTEGHQKYLGAKPAADRLAERQAALQKAADFETQLAESVRRKQGAFEKANGEFDAAAMESARKKFNEAAEQLARESANLANALRELAREQARLAEWKAAARKRDVVLVACGKLRACIDLTQKARQLLQKAAPRVAQQVCRRIAGRAQQLFNQINPEPIELEWHSERYGLRIDPGERRFAMLSGGEQTKLALAMTLAMLQELCGLKFCVFDEPTYGVDMESRQKLADAILRLQDLSAGKLDQVLLVSHDDAFEGKIENVVMIRKTASEGSSPAPPI